MKTHEFMAKHRDLLNKSLDAATGELAEAHKWVDSLNDRERAIHIILANGLIGWGKAILAESILAGVAVNEFLDTPPEDL